MFAFTEPRVTWIALRKGDAPFRESLHTMLLGSI